MSKYKVNETKHIHTTFSLRHTYSYKITHLTRSYILQTFDNRLTEVKHINMIKLALTYPNHKLTIYLCEEKIINNINYIGYVTYTIKNLLRPILFIIDLYL